MLYNKNQVRIANDKKKLVKKGKNWIVASAFVLALAAGGYTVAGQVNADTATKSQAQVVTMNDQMTNISQSKKISDTNNGNGSTSKDSSNELKTNYDLNQPKPENVQSNKGFKSQNQLVANLHASPSNQNSNVNNRYTIPHIVYVSGKDGHWQNTESPFTEPMNVVSNSQSNVKQVYIIINNNNGNNNYSFAQGYRHPQGKIQINNNGTPETIYPEQVIIGTVNADNTVSLQTNKSHSIYTNNSSNVTKLADNNGSYTLPASRSQYRSKDYTSSNTLYMVSNPAPLNVNVSSTDGNYNKTYQINGYYGDQVNFSVQNDQPGYSSYNNPWTSIPIPSGYKYKSMTRTSDYYDDGATSENITVSPDTNEYVPYYFPIYVQLHNASGQAINKEGEEINDGNDPTRVNINSQGKITSIYGKNNQQISGDDGLTVVNIKNQGIPGSSNQANLDSPALDFPAPFGNKIIGNYISKNPYIGIWTSFNPDKKTIDYSNDWDSTDNYWKGSNLNGYGKIQVTNNQSNHLNLFEDFIETSHPHLLKSYLNNISIESYAVGNNDISDLGYPQNLQIINNNNLDADSMGSIQWFNKDNQNVTLVDGNYNNQIVSDGDSAYIPLHKKGYENNDNLPIPVNPNASSTLNDLIWTSDKNYLEITFHENDDPTYTFVDNTPSQKGNDVGPVLANSTITNSEYADSSINSVITKLRASGLKPNINDVKNNISENAHLGSNWNPHIHVWMPRARYVVEYYVPQSISGTGKDKPVGYSKPMMLNMGGSLNPDPYVDFEDSYLYYEPFYGGNVSQLLVGVAPKGYILQKGGAQMGLRTPNNSSAPYGSGKPDNGYPDQNNIFHYNLWNNKQYKGQNYYIATIPVEPDNNIFNYNDLMMAPLAAEEPITFGLEEIDQNGNYVDSTTPQSQGNQLITLDSDKTFTITEGLKDTANQLWPDTRQITPDTQIIHVNNFNVPTIIWKYQEQPVSGSNSQPINAIYEDQQGNKIGYVDESTGSIQFNGYPNQSIVYNADNPNLAMFFNDKGINYNNGYSGYKGYKRDQFSPVSGSITGKIEDNSDNKVTVDVTEDPNKPLTYKLNPNQKQNQGSIQVNYINRRTGKVLKSAPVQYGFDMTKPLDLAQGSSFETQYEPKGYRFDYVNYVNGANEERLYNDKVNYINNQTQTFNVYLDDYTNVSQINVIKRYKDNNQWINESSVMEPVEFNGYDNEPMSTINPATTTINGTTLNTIGGVNNGYQYDNQSDPLQFIVNNNGGYWNGIGNRSVPTEYYDSLEGQITVNYIDDTDPTNLKNIKQVLYQSKNGNPFKLNPNFLNNLSNYIPSDFRLDKNKYGKYLNGNSISNLQGLIQNIAGNIKQFKDGDSQSINIYVNKPISQGMKETKTITRTIEYIDEDTGRSVSPSVVQSITFDGTFNGENINWSKDSNSPSYFSAVQSPNVEGYSLPNKSQINNSNPVTYNTKPESETDVVKYKKLSTILVNYITLNGHKFIQNVGSKTAKNGTPFDVGEYMDEIPNGYEYAGLQNDVDHFGYNDHTINILLKRVVPAHVVSSTITIHYVDAKDTKHVIKSAGVTEKITTPFDIGQYLSNLPKGYEYAGIKGDIDSFDYNDHTVDVLLTKATTPKVAKSTITVDYVNKASGSVIGKAGSKKAEVSTPFDVNEYMDKIPNGYEYAGLQNDVDHFGYNDQTVNILLNRVVPAHVASSTITINYVDAKDTNHVIKNAGKVTEKITTPFDIGQYLSNLPKGYEYAGIKGDVDSFDYDNHTVDVLLTKAPTSKVAKSTITVDYVNKASGSVIGKAGSDTEDITTPFDIGQYLSNLPSSYEYAGIKGDVNSFDYDNHTVSILLIKAPKFIPASSNAKPVKPQSAKSNGTSKASAKSKPTSKSSAKVVPNSASGAPDSSAIPANEPSSSASNNASTNSSISSASMPSSASSVSASLATSSTNSSKASNTSSSTSNGKRSRNRAAMLKEQANNRYSRYEQREQKVGRRVYLDNLMSTNRNFKFGDHRFMNLCHSKRLPQTGESMTHSSAWAAALMGLSAVMAGLGHAVGFKKRHE